VIQEAATAEGALLGPIWPAVRLLDPASAAMLVGDARRVLAWAELLRLQSAAHELRGELEDADRLASRADALVSEADRLERAAGRDPGELGSAPRT
jgi:hypothetical protein